MEEWKHINEYPDYMISNLGRVLGKRSLFIKPHKSYNGYLRTKLYNKNGFKRFLIHRLVLEHFGSSIRGTVVNHKDGNKCNNCINNLEWLSPKENVRHAIRNGLRNDWSGEGNPNSKLSYNEIYKIRKLYTDKKISVKHISEMYGINRNQVRRIATGKQWSNS